MPTICRSLPKRDEWYLAIFGKNDETARVFLPMESLSGLIDRGPAVKMAGHGAKGGGEKGTRCIIHTAMREGIGLPTQVLGINQKLESHKLMFTIAQSQH